MFWGLTEGFRCEMIFVIRFSLLRVAPVNVWSSVERLLGCFGGVGLGLRTFTVRAILNGTYI